MARKGPIPMGRNRILLLGLLLVLLISLVVSTADKLIPAITELIQIKPKVGGELLDPESKTSVRDKKVCGTCHSDKSNDFKKKYQHAPFVKWLCTDCHVPHNLGTGKYEFVVDVDKLCATCHYDRKGEAQMSMQHPPFAKGRCTECHDPHASDHAKLLILPQKQLCQTCHNVNMKYDFAVKHPPYQKGNCTDCHSAHASNNRGLTVLPGKELCFSCHYDRMNELKANVTHKPFVEGDCVDCHGPHATPNSKLLVLSKEKLCFSCHDEKAMESKTGFQHKPFVEGDCVGCHTPHGSKQDNLLLREKSELCYMCHANYREVFKGPSYHPVGNGLLECYGCHDPHSGPGKKMTKANGNELCYTCHLGLKDSYEKLAHATKAVGKAGKGQCLNCHVAHASQNKPLLQGPQEAVCDQCHGKVTKAAINHPVGAKYTDPWRGGQMYCSSCHGPHGTPNPYFTLLSKDELCLKCHGKKVNGEYQIHKTIEPLNEKKPKTIITRIPGKR